MKTLMISAFFAVMFLFPIGASAAADLAILARDISFSEKILIAGEQVRVYASVRNVGDEDMSGYVFFYQGGGPAIGPSQVVSVISGGENDQVWADFIVPNGSFNIRAEIRGQNPVDTNTSNNVAVSGLFHPIFDADRDGKIDEEDNCVDDANVDQADVDGDGIGDVCDPDDNNNGIEDNVEGEIREEVAIPAEEEIEATPVIVSKPEIAQVMPLARGAVEGIQTIADQEPEAAELTVTTRKIFGKSSKGGIVATSPKTSFTYMPIGWKEYGFRALREDDGLKYAWSFGTDATSSKSQVTYVFPQPGEYTVTLTVTDQNGNVEMDSVNVHVSFFDLQNPIVVLLLGAIGVVFLTSLVILVIPKGRTSAYRSIKLQLKKRSSSKIVPVKKSVATYQTSKFIQRKKDVVKRK